MQNVSSGRLSKFLTFKQIKQGVLSLKEDIKNIGSQFSLILVTCLEF